jgi:hypothetical protein
MKNEQIIKIWLELEENSYLKEDYENQKDETSFNDFFNQELKLLEIKDKYTEVYFGEEDETD